MIVQGWAGIGFVHTKKFEVEIDDEDLEGLDEEERNRYIDEVVGDYVYTNIFEWGWCES